MKYKLYLLAAFTFLGTAIAHAQSWQWAKRGGGVLPFNTSGGFYDDRVEDMATDLKGNVYILSYVGCTSGSDINIDGNIKKGNDGTDVAISSFRCDGTFRWMKIIGDKSNCYGLQLKTDTLGGVYISLIYSRRSPSLRKIDTDTTLSTTDQTMILLKYDSAGVYKWLRFPEASTVSFFANAGRGRILSMDVKGNGEISLLSALVGGTYANGAYTVSDTTKTSVHMLKYNAGGIFIKGFKMDIDGDGGGIGALRMKWDTKRDKYILYGGIYLGTNVPLWDTLTLGTTTLPYSAFICEFDNVGSLKWLKQNNSKSTGIDRLALDRNSNIYAIGSLPNTSIINTYVVTNTLGTSSTSFIIKMDSSGNHKWGANSSNVNTSYPQDFAIISDTLMYAAAYTGKWQWGSISLSSSGQCLIRMNTSTGAVMKYDTMVNGGYISNFVADRYGNFYGGGVINNSTYKIGSTTLTKAGGATDFVIAQYGFGNCTTPIIDKPSSITETFVSGNIKIYPNPANEFLYIEGAEKGTEIRLFDLVGKQVYSSVINENREQIAIADLTEGLYLLQFRNQQGNTYSAKIIKQ